MSQDESDLPVLRVVDNDLPILAPGLGPAHEPAVVAHTGWINLASQRHVRGMACGRDGDLWLATGGGVLRWQPSTSRYTRFASEHGLHGNMVVAVAVDGVGHVWALGQSGGLSYLAGSSWHPYPLPDMTPLVCMVIDGAGQLIAASATTVFRVAGPGSAPLEIPHDLGLPPGALAGGAGGEIFLANAQGLFRHDRSPDGWQVMHLDEPVLALASHRGHLWVGTASGLLRLSLAGGEPFRCPLWPERQVTAIAPLGATAWVACGAQIGLAEEINWVPVPGGNPALWVTSMVAAGKDEVWIGTHDGLLRGTRNGMRFQLTAAPPDVFNPLDVDPMQSPATFCNLVQALAAQPSPGGSRLWIGTARELVTLEQAGDNWMLHQESVLHGTTALRALPNGQGMLVAGWGGLHRLPEGGRPVSMLGQVEPALDLALGPDGVLWAATLNGLYSEGEDGWKQRLAAPPLGGRWIRALATLGSELLLATSAGLLVYRPEDKHLDSMEPPGPAEEVRALLVAADEEGGMIFAGTERGLFAGRRGALAPVEACEGCVVTALAWDAVNRVLWVGTEEGLYHLLPAGDSWAVADTFTPDNSGLGAPRVTALLLLGTDTASPQLWIGTRAGLSCYS